MIKKHLQSGFSLVETLVAITILLVVIIGPMTISSTTAKSTSFASEQVIAFFLAQEGVELAQKARDDMILRNFLDATDSDYDPNPWSDFTDDSSGPYEECYTSSGCGLELNTDSVGSLATPIDCASDCQLYLDTSAGANRSRYTYTSGGNTETPFTREIFFQNDGIDEEVRVISRVTWRTGSLSAGQQVQVETYLFNVYGN